MGNQLRKEVGFMLVYVINQHGKPLMPCSPRKARLLLKEQKAKVVSGYFNLGKLDGTKVSASASYKKLRLLERANTFLCERRESGFLPGINSGVSAA